MDDKIIPFGKHKGKPIEVLASDKEYSDWLVAQSWFREKHINLYNIVINNFREPVDTPEHNKIQIKFLKEEYRLKLAYLLNPSLFEENSKKITNAIHSILNSSGQQRNEYFLKALAFPSKGDEYGLYTRQLLRLSKPVFERVDVSFSISYGLNFFYGNEYGTFSQFRHKSINSCLIEIKPTVSDDFPAVLRQMKASMPVKRNEDMQRQNLYALLIGNYTGTSATLDEFVEYFDTQGYKVVFENELDNLKLPEFEIELKLDKEIEERIKNCSQ